MRCLRYGLMRVSIQFILLLLLWMYNPLLGSAAAFSFSWSYKQSVGLLWRGINPSKGLYIHTEQHKHRINAHNTDIHALSGTRIHDPSVRANEGSSCCRPRDHYDWQFTLFHCLKHTCVIPWVCNMAEERSRVFNEILVISILRSRHILKIETSKSEMII
jgi:hypothetical protein